MLLFKTVSTNYKDKSQVRITHKDQGISIVVFQVVVLVKS